MAKAPRRGEVKTRLVPPLTAEQAAALSSCFVKDITTNFMEVARLRPARGFVAYSPPGAASLFRDLVPSEIRMLPPRRVGLAYSLLHATEDLIAAGYGGACLVNADSPTLPTELLLDAIDRLGAPGDRVVLGPAIDGGYYLIGLKQAHARLFEDIAWSTEHVFRQTVERAASIGLPVVTLAPWYDVDDAVSLRWLSEEVLANRLVGGLRSAGYAAPYTTAYLRRLVETSGVEALGFGATAETVDR
jgi:rSAM/selenodomain-associated transferase 1